MDYNQYDKISRTISGTIFFILSILFFALSFYFYNSPIKEPDVERHARDTLALCEEIAKSKGYQVRKDPIIKGTGSSITVYKENLYNGVTELYETESIIARCNNVVLTEYCMGIVEADEKTKLSGCSQPGVLMKLTYKEPYAH